MLHYKTIDEDTLGLLRQIMRLREFNNMRLVGGSALALMIGHRTSVGLNLFGHFDAEELAISQSINTFGKSTLLKKSPYIFIYNINNIKVDFMNYPFNWLDELMVEDKIRLAGKKDIAAMKLSAITGRGSKKDFIDLFYLLREFSLGEMLDFYKLKFPDASEFLVLKSLTYFGDCEVDETPQLLDNISWSEIKRELETTINEFLKHY